MQSSVPTSQKVEKPKAHYPVHSSLLVPTPVQINLLHNLTPFVSDKQFNITIQLIVRYLTLSPIFRFSEFDFLRTYALPVHITSPEHFNYRS